MKLNRTQFKKILKECIRELIVEGAFDSVIKENVGAGAVVGNQPGRTAVNDFVGGTSGYEVPSMPSMPYGTVGQLSPAQRLRDLAKVTAAHSARGDQKQTAIMEQIFADTAMTTLQHQLGNEMTGGGGVFIGEQPNPQNDRQDQMEIQTLNGGRPLNHWAALAFGKYEKK